jgi:hypothetical protein
MFELFHTIPLDAFHQEPDHNEGVFHDHNGAVFHEAGSEEGYLEYNPPELEYGFSEFHPEPTGEHPSADGFDSASDHHSSEGEPPGIAERLTPHADQELGGLVDWWHNLVHDIWHTITPEHVVTIGGNPEQEAQYYHLQEGDESCAVAAQTCVLESIFPDRHFNEADLAHIAEEKGWYSPQSGTPREDVGNLLQEFNVPIERHTDFTFTEIYDAVNHGDKVIVGLNPNEIWNPQHGADGSPLHQAPAGHAVWVTGFELNDQGKVEVVLNDTGTPDGRGSRIPVDDFRNAWNEYSNFAVVTHLNGAQHAA